MQRLRHFNFCRCCSLLVRQNFATECENGLNEQINLELKACHEYLAMAYHFDRCDVASPGAFKFFKNASDEEREHAELFMAYMNKRGGDIKLTEIIKPKTAYESIKEAMVDALNMEMVVNKALLTLHSTANDHGDPNLCSFIEHNFLQEQVNSAKYLADLIKQIERVECDVGCFLIDQHLLKGTRTHQK